MEKKLKNHKVQTIEKTGKFYKGMMLVGLIIMAFALLVAYQGDFEQAFNVFVIGLVIFIVGKIFKWWYHG